MTNKLFKSKIVKAIFLLISLLCFAIFGFKYISGLSWIDAVYMAVITISFVGFEELGMSSNSKIFIVILVISSAIILGYSIKIITEYIVSLYSKNFKNKKMQNKIDRLTNHTIVCGFGRNGSQVAKKLGAYNKPYVVIDSDANLQTDNINEFFINGDAIKDEVLLNAGILNASFLICTLPNDADNLFVVLTAKQLNPNLKIISKALEESSYKKLKLAGADNVIMPDSLGGSHMAQLVATPDVLEFIDEISIEGENQINIESIDFSDIPSDFQYKKISDLKKEFSVCNIIGFKNPLGHFIINPNDDTEITPKSKLIVLGNSEEIKKLNQIFGI